MNKTLVLKSRPSGMLAESDFEIVDLPVPEPQDGEILTHNFYASLDPGLRVLLGQDDGYMTPTAIGSPMRTNIVGKTLRVEGFLSFTHNQSFPSALRELEEWILAGQLTYREQIGPNIESAPATFISLFIGRNLGKTLVKLADVD
jgi:NADPH-dependent curcumin reductase CurA